MAVGRHSSLTRIRRRIFSLVYCDSGNAQRTAHIEKSWWVCQAAAVWFESCTCTVLQPPFIPATRRSFSIRYVDPELDLAADIQGIGTLLMEEAERIAREEHGSGRIAVISGVGTRDYYRRLGYFLDGPYMVKDLLYDD